jgi:hypothetical protein
MSDKNIYQRINEVRKQVEYVQKDATVDAGGGRKYAAVTHDMVTAVLRKAMVDNGIVTRVEQLRSQVLQEKAPKAEGDKGHKMYLYSGDYAIHFVNIDHPDDCFTVTINAHAQDSGDKAPGKCASYAVKVALLKTFNLETGENEEARFADPFTEEQLAVYHELLEAEKAYEFYLFVKTLPPETQTGLVNSFPDGKKSQGKKAAAKLEKAGFDKFNEVVDEVQERLASQDISVVEITHEMSPVEKKLLASRLKRSFWPRG